MGMPRDAVEAKPPRPIAPGDIVACFADELGEWSAAQITDLNSSSKLAGVLELDWSGPEPDSVGDLGLVQPLLLTHHAWTGKPSHTNYPWVLPRSYKVIGSLPLFRDHSDSYSSGWNVGRQLAMQRQWDRGDRDVHGLPGEIKLTASEFDAYVADRPGADLRSLRVEDVEALDCARLADAFPGLTDLILIGKLGRLENANSLNRLSLLKALGISNLFGMTESDSLMPDAVPALEWLALKSVPREYGTSMRSVWGPELAKGCFTAITALRSPEWLAENIDNPLRDWDGREHISQAKFRKSVTQYKTTRRAVLSALADPPADLAARLIELGREYGAAFNRLSQRDGFIETEEREELFAALAAIPRSTALLSEEAAKLSGDRLVEGLEEVRDW